MEQYIYYIILGLSLLYPLAQSFERRISLYRKWKFIIPAIFATGAVFIIWDILFTNARIWGFNHSYTGHIYVFGLPLEEWLFFLVIPYCIFFTHEVILYFFKKPHFPVFSRILTWILLVSGTIALPFVYEKTYTFTAIAFLLPFLALQLIVKSHRSWLSSFYITYLVSLIPFLLVNGFLTKIPVVWYNNFENLSVRIGTIPVEDLIYLMGMLLPSFTIYYRLKR